ncbi:hypothetical protein ACXYN8_09425 [Altererythrobacter sp. CAU 1778]
MTMHSTIAAPDRTRGVVQPQRLSRRAGLRASPLTPEGPAPDIHGDEEDAFLQHMTDGEHPGQLG